jgi:hypothetical protein
MHSEARQHQSLVGAVFSALPGCCCAVSVSVSRIRAASFSIPYYNL